MGINFWGTMKVCPKPRWCFFVYQCYLLLIPPNMFLAAEMPAGGCLIGFRGHVSPLNIPLFYPCMVAKKIRLLFFVHTDSYLYLVNNRPSFWEPCTIPLLSQGPSLKSLGGSSWVGPTQKVWEIPPHFIPWAC